MGGSGVTKHMTKDLRETGEKVEVVYPETFKFEKEGDYFQGKVEVLGYVNTKDGQSLRMVLTDELGDSWTIWANGVLEGKLKVGGISEGDFIGIEFTGWQKSPSSNFKYKNYELYIQKRAAK